MFFPHVNDIGNSCQCNIISFVDDTTLYTSHSDINGSYSIAHEQLDNLFTWSCASKLGLNEGKTKYGVIKPSYMRPNLARLNITITGIQLDGIGNKCNETCCKIRGIQIVKHLTWNGHIN